MKKKLLSFAAALLLTLNMLPCAYADYITIGSCVAGDEINCFISDVPADATVTAQSLPFGCELASEPENGLTRLYLRGRPIYAGEQSFTLDIVGTISGSIVCSLDVLPDIPTVTQSGSVRCSKGESVLLTVGASIDDAGLLSYQWFRENGAPLQGAAGNSYAPDTSVTGLSRYYCEVTNNNGGRTAAVNTGLFTVEVTEPVLQSVSVATIPTKTEYVLGDRPDTTGLSLMLIYSDGGSAIVNTGFGVSPAAFTAEGIQTVELDYQGKKCSYQVTVKSSAESIEGIGVVTLPTKTSYTVGDGLETAGLSIRVYTAAGHYDVATGLSCSPVTLNTEGDQTITVKYGDKTCTFKVKVESDKLVVKSLAVVQKPTLLKYTVGDRLDSTGLIVRVTTNKGTEDISTGFACTPKVLAAVGQQTVTVVYGAQTCSFTVEVAAKDLKPSPSPSLSPSPSASPSSGVSPSPGQASASPSYKPSYHESHETKASNTLVKVIVVVSALALAGLGAYVYIMQRKGRR